MQDTRAAYGECLVPGLSREVGPPRRPRLTAFDCGDSGAANAVVEALAGAAAQRGLVDESTTAGRGIRESYTDANPPDPNCPAQRQLWLASDNTVVSMLVQWVSREAYTGAGLAVNAVTYPVG